MLGPWNSLVVLKMPRRAPPVPRMPEENALAFHSFGLFRSLSHVVPDQLCQRGLCACQDCALAGLCPDLLAQSWGRGPHLGSVGLRRLPITTGRHVGNVAAL